MIEVNHLLMQVFQAGISTRNPARIALFGVLLSSPSYHIQFHSHYRGCNNFDENSGLFNTPKSGTSVSAAGVNDHRGLETPRTMSLQHNQHRGKRGTRHSGEFRDSIPIRPTTNQVSCPPNTITLVHQACLSFLTDCDFSGLRNKLCLSLLVQT